MFWGFRVGLGFFFSINFYHNEASVVQKKKSEMEVSLSVSALKLYQEKADFTLP